MIDWLSWFDEICFVWCVFYVVWCEVKQEAAAAAAAADESGGQQLEREDNDMMMKYCRPDLLLDSPWFGGGGGSTSTSNKDHCGLLIDPLSALFPDDFCNVSSMPGPSSPFDV